jgi:Aldolase/RraA/Carboxypeptidase regulatory-like domain
VLVVDGQGEKDPALWGGLTTLAAHRKKLEGVVIDGVVRDIADIRHSRLPVFARAVVPNAGRAEYAGEVGVIVQCRGVVVSPEDWVVGDEDGVVVVPAGRLEEAAAIAGRILSAELHIARQIRAGHANIYFLPLSTHMKVLLVTAGASLALICIALTSGVAAVVRRLSKKVRRNGSATGTIRKLSGLTALSAASAFMCAFAYLPGGPLFNSTFLRVAFTVLTSIVTAATFITGFSTLRLLRDPAAPKPGRIQSVRGTVQDPTGAVIPNVAVAATNRATGVELRTKSNESGIYVLPAVLPGSYRLEAELAGMKKFEANVTVQVSQSTTVDISLQPSGTQTVVNVQDVNPMLTSERMAR